MSARRIIPFKISTMDSLGQGVSKESDKITFISKTALGDEGEAEITAEKKGVAFGRMTRLTKASELRISPDCPHFSDCPSCHYLHVPYEQELNYKKKSLENLFHNYPLPDVEVIPAIRRMSYRNRIQLHYDLKHRTLGMFDIKKRIIVPIPECKIGITPIQEEVQRLYQNDQWLKEAPTRLQRGHVEIYFKGGKLLRTWNRPYAEGGFTQVFDEMNQKLKLELDQWLSQRKLSDIVDLFGGNGNLSKGLPYSNRLCVDQYPESKVEFFSQDLYSPQALPKVKTEILNRGLNPNTLLLDPPRSGLKGLKYWLKELQPDYFVYVSCDPHTLARDVKEVQTHQLQRAILVDFFPSTYHFESMFLFERIN